MILKAREFFDFVRAGGGDKLVGPEKIEDAITALETIFEQHVAIADAADGMPRRTRDAFLFWNGAVMGVKLALRGYMMRLREAGKEAGVKVEESV